MKVKSLVKLMHNQDIDIIDEFDGLLMCIEVDDKGEVYAKEGWKYSQYELFENSCVTDVHASNFNDDTIIITVK